MRLYQRFTRIAARFMESVEMPGEIPALSGTGVFCRPLGRNMVGNRETPLLVMLSIHQRKGTVAAVRRVIETLGYSMTLQEWWKVADPAGTFRLEIDLNDIGITETMIKELERIIGDAKPVSRHISQLTLSASVYGMAHIGAAVVDGEIITVYPPGYEPDDSIYYDAAVNYDGNYHYSGK